MSEAPKTQSAIRNPQSTIGYHFCTYFDRNYLTRGLALYESLRQHCRQPFVLWILCFDEETYNILARLALPGVRLISEEEFEVGDEALVCTKAGRSRVEYYWTCTPSLPLYVLAHNPEVELITYLDADLYFYGDPAPIYEEMGDASILIVEHRYAPEYASLAVTSGIYNVGWMSFRRTPYGLTCLTWWRERCLEWCYAHYEDGKFGDQKYLDDWPQRFQGVAVLQHKGAGLAPWNARQYRLAWTDGHLTVDGQPLIFFHFHAFRCVHDRAVEPAGYGYCLPSLLLERVFLPYAVQLSALSRQIGRSFVDPGRTVTGRELRSGLLTQRLLLIHPHWLAMSIWRLAGFFRRNRDRVASGFVAYQQGDLATMRCYFLQAIARNPLLLRNLGIVSLLIESVVGTQAMVRYRAWRHKASHCPDECV
ncbi:MAG TPA: hypothetical protein PLJ78_04370 [Anaerolineae bacterium]|nr:hypothetical protein [Anaerolineae bacterium]HQK13167.1 hypothetical protein [Anaerolineae bacterium]